MLNNYLSGCADEPGRCHEPSSQLSNASKIRSAPKTGYLCCCNMVNSFGTSDFAPALSRQPFT